MEVPHRIQYAAIPVSPQFSVEMGFCSQDEIRIEIDHEKRKLTVTASNDSGRFEREITIPSGVETSDVSYNLNLDQGIP